MGSRWGHYVVYPIKVQRLWWINSFNIFNDSPDMHRYEHLHSNDLSETSLRLQISIIQQCDVNSTLFHPGYLGMTGMKPSGSSWAEIWPQRMVDSNWRMLRWTFPNSWVVMVFSSFFSWALYSVEFVNALNCDTPYPNKRMVIWKRSFPFEMTQTYRCQVNFKESSRWYNLKSKYWCMWDLQIYIYIYTSFLRTEGSHFSIFPHVFPGMKKVSIGSSLDSHVKCVEDPGDVHCDHTAKQLGRTGHSVVTELAICHSSNVI